MCELIQRGAPSEGDSMSTNVRTSVMEGQPGEGNMEIDGFAPSSSRSSTVAPSISAASSSANFVVPRFKWLARDFDLQLVDKEGKPWTPQQYFEVQLQNQPQAGATQKNKIRECIRQVFPNREFIAIPRPFLNEQQSKRVEELREDELSAEYVARMKWVYQQVRNDTPKKKDAHGNPVSGRVFAKMVRLYVDAINRGVLPDMEQSYSALSSVRCLSAKALAIKSWKEEMKKAKLVQASPDVMEEQFSELLQDAISVYSNGPMRAYGEKFESTLSELREEIKELESEFRERNQEYIKGIVLREFDMVQVEMSNLASIEELVKFVETAKQNICTKLKAKVAELDATVNNMSTNAASGFLRQFVFQEVAARWDTWIVMFHARQEAKDKKLLKKMQEVEAQSKRMSGFLEDKEKEMARMEKEKVELEEEFKKEQASQQAQMQETIDAQKATLEKLQTSHMSELKIVQTELEELTQREATMKSELDQAERTHHDQLLDLEQEKLRMQEQLTSSEQSSSFLETQQTELLQQIQDLTASRVELSSLRHEHQLVQEKMQALQKDHLQLRKQCEQEQAQYIKRLKEDRAKTDQMFESIRTQYHGRSEELQQQLNEAQESLNAAESAKAELERDSAALQISLRENADEHKKTVAKLTREIEAAQKKAREVAEQMKQQQEQQDILLRSETQKFESRLEAVRETSKIKIEGLEKDYRMGQDELRKAERNMLEWKSKAQTLEAHRETPEQKNERKMLETNLKRADIDNLQLKHEVQRLQERLRTMETDLQYHRDLADKANENCMRIKKEAEESLQSKIMEYRQEYYQSSLNNATASANNNNNARNSLTRR